MTERPRVLLLLPSFSSTALYGSMSKVAPSLIPVSLVYLAAYLRQQGVPVAIFDGQVESMTDDSLAERLRSERPQVVGITCMTPMVMEARRAAAVARRTLPEALVVMGGIHPTILPEETIRDENVDVVVRGEGEHALAELVAAGPDRDRWDSIQGLTFRRAGAVVHTPDRCLLDDLDSLPYPAFDLVPIDRYHQIPDAVFALPLRGIITSRGCPFRCIFCSARLSSGFRYRYRSPENVLGEWELLADEYRARQIAVLDDNFVVERERTVRICELLIARGLHRRTVWTCAARADQVDRELLALMRRAGCKLVSFGVETGTQRLLDLIEKSLTLEQIEQAIRAAREAGLLTRGTLILGLPTETREDSQRTIEFALGLGLDFAKFSIATPYPGTVLYELARRQGLIDEDADYSRFSSMAGFAGHEPVFVPEGRAAREIMQLQKQATRAFYFRPRQIVQLLRNTRSWQDLKLYYYAARSLLGK